MQGLALRGCLATAALALVALAPSAGAATIEVTENDVSPAGDWSRADTRLAGTGVFVNGPATPPAGAGSYEMTTTSTGDKIQLMTDRHAGTALADIDGIGYSTYKYVGGGPVAMAAINMRVDLTGDGIADRYFVYEPYQDLGNAAVQTGTWQTWDAYRGGAAKWWVSGTTPPTTAHPCNQSTPCTFATLVAMHPTATIAEAPNFRGSFGVNQGSGNTNTKSSADALSISIGGDSTTYDFEPLVGPPASKDDCKKGGWQQYNNPSFKNQGDCVSHVARS